MLNVTHISSPSEIPEGQKYVLVTYGEEGGQKRDSLGLTITVPRSESDTLADLALLAAVHSAKEIAKQEHIQAVFACR
jgi:hypothetical protein